MYIDTLTGRNLNARGCCIYNNDKKKKKSCFSFSTASVLLRFVFGRVRTDRLCWKLGPLFNYFYAYCLVILFTLLYLKLLNSTLFVVYLFIYKSIEFNLLLQNWGNVKLLVSTRSKFKYSITADLFCSRIIDQ